LGPSKKATFTIKYFDDGAEAIFRVDPTLVGGLGAVVGGTLCARIGSGLAGSNGGCDGFCCCDEGAIIGGLVGYLVGSNLGSATGVCLVGNSGGEKGSYWASLGGSILGTLLGSLFAGAIARGSNDDSEVVPLVLLTGSNDDDSGVLPLFVLSAAQASGATIGFNATRKRKVEMPSGAMLNLKDGNLAFAFPQVNTSQDAFNSNCYKVNFFKANF